jgi:hypothetical protein
LASGSTPRYLEKAFNHICESRQSHIPATIEILMIPRVAVAVIIHAPIGASSGQPVPLGILSFDEAVLARAQKYVLDNIDSYIKEGDMLDQIEAELSKVMGASVAPVNSGPVI